MTDELKRMLAAGLDAWERTPGTREHMLRNAYYAMRQLDPQLVIHCRHEPYHGRCAHCDAPIVNGRVA